MIPSHKDVFFVVADRLMCEIGVRETNLLSDKWVGKPGYIPKSQKCKAKTANNPDFKFGGLVVNPFLLPEAFASDSLIGSKDKWANEFVEDGKLPTGFSCADKGDEKGLLKYDGCAIHADYDLMYVHKVERYGRKAFMDSAEARQLGLIVQTQLNIYLGIPMIQHGAEMGWRGGVGAANEELVYIFKPGRGLTSIESRVPTKKENKH